MNNKQTPPLRSLAHGAALCAILFAGSAQAALTLIDSSTRNGGFETATLSGSPPEASFANTANWVNLTGDQSVQAVRDNLVRTGNHRGVIADNGSRLFGNDTGYTLTAGDTINFSYWWRDAFNWLDGEDQVQFTLFTTVDDDIFGTVDQSQSWLSGLSTVNDTYEEYSNSFTATAPWDGKRLFVSIEGISGPTTGSVGFAGLDDVLVEVVPIPEPSAALLLGLGLLALLRCRR